MGVWLCDEAVPGVAGGVDDVVVGVEDAVGEPVRAQILPDIFDRVQFRGAGGQEDQGDVCGYDELGCGVPSGAVEQQNRMRAPGHRSGDLVEMGLHGVGVGEGHGEGCADAPCRADRSKEIGAFVALVGGLARPRSAPGPLPDKAVLLADAGLILEPEFDRPALRDMGEMGLQRHREVFLNASITRSSWAGWCGRALMWEKPICFSSLPIVRS